MAHIVDATPSSSAGAAQLFAAAAALEDGNEDATDYSSINRWGFNAVQAFEYCILIKTFFMVTDPWHFDSDPGFQFHFDSDPKIVYRYIIEIDGSHKI